jgi:hypothetical protein
MPQSQKKLKRPTQQIFRVDETELNLIHEKMATAGVRNKQTFYRKMILEGYIVRIDFSDVREMIRLLRNATNNLNQIAKRINTGNSIHKSDIADIQQNYEKLWQWAAVIAKKLANMKG